MIIYILNIFCHPVFFVQVIFGDSNWAPRHFLGGRKNSGMDTGWDLAVKSVRALQVIDSWVEIRGLALCRRTFNFGKFRSYRTSHWFIMNICYVSFKQKPHTVVHLCTLRISISCNFTTLFHDAFQWYLRYLGGCQNLVTVGRSPIHC